MDNNIFSLKELFKNFIDLPDYINKYLDTNNFNDEITINGYIKSIKKFNTYNNNYIYYFNLTDDKYNLSCNCKINRINDLILNNENKKVNLIGYLYSNKSKNNLYGLKVDITFNVLDLYIDENNKDINLYDTVKQLGYLENKKKINWKKIKNIALLSKNKTHGYNDFMTVINKDYFNIDLFEITLEGSNTERDLINTINNINDNYLNDYDIILILRGGGSTDAMSSSFDKMNIFKSIKNSNIPICSAIGHSDDTDEKLIITQITDYDFITPTEAGIFLNNFIPNLKPNFDKLLSNVILNKFQKYNNYNHIKQNINYLLLNKQLNIKNSIKSNISNYLSFLNETFDNILNSYFNDLSNLKIKTKYNVIDIDNNLNFNDILLFHNNTYYKLNKISVFNQYNNIYKFNNFIDNFISQKKLISQNDFINLKKNFKINTIKYNYFLFLKNKYYSSNDNIFNFFVIYNQFKSFYNSIINNSFVNINDLYILLKNNQLLNNQILFDFILFNSFF